MLRPGATTVLEDVWDGQQMQIQLHLIDAAQIGDRLVLQKDSPDHALVWDHGDTDLTCGRCGFTLAARVLGPEILDGYVLECPDCGATNSPT